MKEIVFGVSAAGSMYIAGIPKEDVLIIPNNFYYGSIATQTDLDAHWKNIEQNPKKENFEKSIKNKEQFAECNNQLKEAVEKDPELAKKFTPEQLEQIRNGDTPDGYTD